MKGFAAALMTLCDMALCNRYAQAIIGHADSSELMQEVIRLGAWAASDRKLADRLE